MATQHQVGETVKLTYYLVVDGKPLAGEVVDLILRRDSDGFFLSSTGTAFAAPLARIRMTETDSSAMPGLYEYSFDQSIDNVARNYQASYQVPGCAATLEELEFVGGVDTPEALSAGDFGGVQERRIYDRRDRGFKPLYGASFGLTRLGRARRVLAAPKKPTSPIVGSKAQGASGAGESEGGTPIS